MFPATKSKLTRSCLEVLSSWKCAALFACHLSACTGLADATTEQGSLYGVRIQAFNGLPALDVAIQIDPRSPTEALAQPTSQLVVDALRVCTVLATAPNALDAPTTLLVSVVGGHVQRSNVGSGRRSELSACLEAAMIGQRFALPVGRHSLTIVLRTAASE